MPDPAFASVSASKILRDANDKSLRNGLFTLIGPYAHPVKIIWDSIHRGAGGGDHSEAYSRVYFSTPSTGDRILLWEKSDGRFNTYNLVASEGLSEERRTIHLPAMVEATMIMEYGNLRATVTEVKFPIVVQP